MKTAFFTRVVLLVSGALATLIGVGIVFAPDAFYESYQVLLPQSASLRSELRGMGSFLLFSGGLVLVGAMRTSLRFTALIVAGGLYGAFSIGRLVSLVVDGNPSSAILTAWVVEVGMFCLIVIVGLVNRKHKHKHTTTVAESYCRTGESRHG